MVGKTPVDKANMATTKKKTNVVKKVKKVIVKKPKLTENIETGTLNNSINDNTTETVLQINNENQNTSNETSNNTDNTTENNTDNQTDITITSDTSSNMSSTSNTFSDNDTQEDQSSKKKPKKVSKESIIEKWENLFTIYESELKQSRKQPQQEVSLQKYLTSLKNDIFKAMKLRKRVTQSTNSGFMKPVAISPVLEKFIEANNGKASKDDVITRCDITRHLCNYIKKNDLQMPSDKRTIVPDTKLKELFDIKEGENEKLTYYSMQKSIQRHIFKLDV